MNINLTQKKIVLSVIATLLLSTSSFASSSEGPSHEEFVGRLKILTERHPITEPTEMYSGTTPMRLIQDENGDTFAVLKQQYTLEVPKAWRGDQYKDMVKESQRRDREKLEKIKRAFVLTKRADVGLTFATGYFLSNEPLTFQKGSEPIVISGLVQPVVTLYSNNNLGIETPLTSILNKIDHPHGALSLLALCDAHETEKWVPMEDGEEVDKSRLQDYDMQWNKRVSVAPKITPEEYGFCMASLSRKTIEDDFLTFMLTQSGDSAFRNWMLELNGEATLVRVKLIDFENILDSSLMGTSPLALHTLQGFYPLSEANREKVMSWDALQLTSDFPGETAKTVQEIIQSLKTHLQADPTLSLQNLYFKVFADHIGGIGKWAHRGWSESQGVMNLLTLSKINVTPQDPSYNGIEHQLPDFEWLSRAFEQTSNQKGLIDVLEEQLTGENQNRYRTGMTLTNYH